MSGSAIREQISWVGTRVRETQIVSTKCVMWQVNPVLM